MKVQKIIDKLEGTEVCYHENAIETTTMGSPMRNFYCPDCKATFSEPFEEV